MELESERDQPTSVRTLLWKREPRAPRLVLDRRASANLGSEVRRHFVACVGVRDFEGVRVLVRALFSRAHKKLSQIVDN